MAGDTLKLALRGFEHFNAGDMDRFWAQIHPDVVMETDPAWPGGGTYEGREAMQRFLTQFLEAFGGVRWAETADPEEIGRWAVLRGRWVGSGAASGIETASVEFSVAFYSEDGLVREVRFNQSAEAARRFARSAQG